MPTTNSKYLYSKDNLRTFDSSNLSSNMVNSTNTTSSPSLIATNIGPMYRTWSNFLTSPILANLTSLSSSPTRGFLSWVAFEVEVRVQLNTTATLLALQTTTAQTVPGIEAYWSMNYPLDVLVDSTLSLNDVPTKPAKPDKDGVFRYKTFWRNRMPKGRKGLPVTGTRYAISSAGSNPIPYTASEYSNVEQAVISAAGTTLGSQFASVEQVMEARGWSAKNIMRLPELFVNVPGVAAPVASYILSMTSTVKIRCKYVLENGAF